MDLIQINIMVLKHTHPQCVALDKIIFIRTSWGGVFSLHALGVHYDIY